MIHSQQTTLELRADLFQSLAEAMHEPPAWLALPGCEWPVTAAAGQLALEGTPAQDVVHSLCGIPPEPLPERQKRFAALFAGAGRPLFWPYESMNSQGRLLSQETTAVENFYQAAGLQVTGAEMPDHMSIELAFIGHLCQQQSGDLAHATQWRALERRFIRDHAGRWLPTLGQELAQTDDEVYGPLGKLLAAVVSGSFFSKRRPKSTTHTKIPFLQSATACSLCGFCVQLCPTRALAIRETGEETQLRLAVQACVGCRKCEPVCPTKTLQVGPVDGLPDEAWIVMQRSPRLTCPGCGEPTVSQAEFDFVVSQIGAADWLAYCLTCRAGQMEKQS